MKRIITGIILSGCIFIAGAQTNTFPSGTIGSGRGIELYPADHGYLLSSYNASASNAEQFNIKHYLDRVDIFNLRGDLVFQPTSGNIGIGTTTPDIFSRNYAKIVGVKSTEGTAAIQVAGVASGVLDLGFGTTRTCAVSGNNTGMEIESFGSRTITMYTNNLPGLLINSSQVVVIPNYMSIGSGRGIITWDAGIFRLLGTGDNAISLGANGAHDQLYIGTNGKVGIGTTSPSVPLDVSKLMGNSAETGADEEVARFLNTHATGGTIVKIGRTGINSSRTASLSFNDEWYAGILRYGGSGTNRFAISTNSDLYSAVPEFAITNGNIGLGALAFGYASTNRRILAINGGESSMIEFQVAGTNRGYLVSTPTVSEWYHEGSLMLTTNGAERMRVSSNGNVGIGTTNPQSKLAVNGDVYAKKVKVTQTGWPDFVFNQEYQLKPLSEVEAFIHKYKHLPEVPSAEEVTKNDLDLGEMNRILLMKVEELTLYMIELKKENDLQKERLDKLEKR